MTAGVGRREPNPSDFYPTPPSVGLALLEWWTQHKTAPPSVIDPCAGTGCLLAPWVGEAVVIGTEADAAIQAVGTDAWPKVFGTDSPVKLGDGLLQLGMDLDIARDPAAWLEGYQGTQDRDRDRISWLYAVNPPFKDADLWVDRLVSITKTGGAAAAILLRSQWIDDGETKGRGIYRWELPPSAILRLPWRVSFDGEGKDSCTYAWHIWDPRSPVYAGSGTPTYWATRPTPTEKSKQLWDAAVAGATGGERLQLDLLRE